MIPLVIVAPAVEPVTVADQKLHSRIDTDKDDALLAGLLLAARERCEGMLGRKLITQTVRWHPDAVADTQPLPLPNVQSVVVKYYDVDGNLTTVDASTVYRVLNANDPANPCVLELLAGQSWPTTDVNRSQPWVIDMVCGYGDGAEFVPAQIKVGISLLTAQWYENREIGVVGATFSALPFTVDALWAAHQWRFVT